MIARPLPGILIVVLCSVPCRAPRAQPDATPVPAAVAQASPRALTLEQALARALAADPGLEAAALDLAAFDALAMQAGRRPNPELSLEAENVLGSGAFRGLRGAETTLSISQRLELGGKRSARRALAQRERDVAAWQRRRRQAEVVERTTTRFLEVAAAQARLRLSDEAIDASQRALAAVGARVDAGGASPVERTRVEVSVGVARIDRQQVANELEGARARLALLWGASVPEFQVVDFDLEHIEPTAPLPDLLERLAVAPELAAWSDESARRAAALSVERSLRQPDLEVLAGARQLAEPRDQALVLQVSAPLPWPDRKQGSIDAAALRLRSLGPERQALAAALQAEVVTAAAEQAAARDEVVALDDHVLPAAQRAFDTAQQAYASGLFRTTDVLDAQRTLFELRARRVSALARHHRAAAALRRLTQLPPESIATEVVP